MFRYFAVFLVFVCSVPVFAQNKIPPGNPRDPLNLKFSAVAKTGDTPGNPYQEFTGDARLNDICFINPQQGWAVGDHGVILATTDGGSTWQQQNSPIDCTLRSVQFSDESFGIAAGDYWFPATKQGRGVILSTHDGGKTWFLNHSPELPPIYRVKVFDAMNILLAGGSTERYPGGILSSNDGGQTWKPKHRDYVPSGFSAAAFFDTKTGIGIGMNGCLLQIQDRILFAQNYAFGLQKIADVKIRDDRRAAAAGERGLILTTDDQGLHWKPVQGTLPGNAAGIVDLQTVETNGSNLWAAGNPGTCIYTSGDDGKTWKPVFTGISAAIRKIFFTDPNNGWAAGDLGTILVTKNGGQTWQVQRTASAKLALLGLFGEPENIPFEAFALLCADQGFLGGCVMIFRNNNNNADSFSRLHEAVIRTGASLTAELGGFPLLRKELRTTSETFINHIQKQTGGHGMPLLRERLVAVIRQYKPEIILTSNRNSPAEEIVFREVLEAVKLAGDPDIFPYQITELGLKTWNVKKVYLTLKNGALGDVHLTASEPAVRFALPLEEMTYISRRLIDTEKTAGHAVIGFTEVLLTVPETKGFFAGIPILPGEESRRKLIGSYADLQTDYQRRALQRRNILGILQNTAASRKTNIVSHAAELTRKLDPDTAVQILLETAERFHADGSSEAAEEAYQYLAKQYGRHPLVRQAFQRLTDYAASDEICFQRYKDNVTETRNNRQRLEKALNLDMFLKQNIPDIADTPAHQFAAASVLRRLGWEQEAVRFYKTKAGWQFDDVWGARARAEYRLTAVPNQSELLMPALICTYAPVKPVIDGRFDEGQEKDVWQNSHLYSLTPEKPRSRLAERLKENGEKNIDRRIGVVREKERQAASKNFGTQAMFLYDNEFLYIGFRCPKVAGFTYPLVAGKQRSRDADLTDQDRIEILIDTDRDYSSYYSLTIDSRGWVSAECGGSRCKDLTWNTARYDGKDAWYIEAAIPFSVLTDRPPLPNTVWSAAVRRIVPGIGIECWNAENSFDLTEGFGWLVFP
ncbi:MAG: hypothetical protein LBH00_08200 [Planctomycetaceae bacterium]|jgi:photosystem II stability/assembly factor-like uncharacterized protein|nr:hypothetical protein [Planctomycetaceae bacterium]